MPHDRRYEPMAEALVIRGHYTAQTFVPEEPLPAVEGAAELIVFPRAAPPRPAVPTSIFDLFGKAARLRSAEEIADQLREERDAWGGP
jgi:hypothetical protein